MSEQPKLRVSPQAVQAARAEVAAFEAAGIADKLDPLVRRIAQAKPVVVAPAVAPQASGGRSAKKKLKNVSGSGSERSGGKVTHHRSAITGRLPRGRVVEGSGRAPRLDS